MRLAMNTGIPAESWRTGDPRDLDTALELLREDAQRRR